MDTEGILGLMQETAAEVITPRFRQLADADIDEKTPGDFVTVADREAEAYLGRLLAAAFPDALIVGEEAAFHDKSLLRQLPNADHAFVIDPIDGTGNFVRGSDEHGVILAETRAGVTTGVGSGSRSSAAATSSNAARASASTVSSSSGVCRTGSRCRAPRRSGSSDTTGRGT